MVASKTDEGIDVAHHFASPLVLRSLVDRLAGFKPSVAVASTRSASYNDASSVSEGSDIDLPQATLTEDLVMKFLACLMVHPQQGQRTRLVLKDEVPESLYMVLHKAGSVPADIKGDSVMALPSVPERDTDNKLYPKKMRAGGESEEREITSAAGRAKAPESLAVPLCIVITNHGGDVGACVDDEADDGGTTTVATEDPVGPAGEVVEERSFVRESRVASLKRSVVAALSPAPHHQRAYEMSRAASSASVDTSPPGSSTSKGGKLRGKGLWQRSSTSLTSSPSNTTSPGNGNGKSSASTSGSVHHKQRQHQQQKSLPEESRPMTLPSMASSLSRGRPLSAKKSPTDKAEERAATLSPSTQNLSPKSRSGISWAAVAAALSPGLPPSERSTS